MRTIRAPLLPDSRRIAGVFFAILQSGPSHRDVESLKVRFRISRTFILWYFDFSRVRYPRIGDASGEERLSSPLEQSIDLRSSTGSVMDLGFHGPYFRCSFGDVIAKITNVQRLVSRFPSLSAFPASDLGLFFRPAPPVRPNRGFPPLLSLPYQTGSFPEPIGFWFFLDVCQRPPRYCWRLQ